MFLVLITLLNVAAIVVIYILLAHKLTSDDVILVVEKTDGTLLKVLDATELVLNYQDVFDRKMLELDKKMDALSRFVDTRNTYVTFQQNEFNALARADMLAARREELLRTKELKVALERLMGVALTSRQPASPNDVLAIENLTKRIEELEGMLNNKGA